MELETIIGLEVHVQLKTASKMFCRCDNRDDQAPNTAICPICTGQPGTLPLPNRQAIDWSIMASLALGCSINQESKFDRKHYFYPDLPKGYQISQYDKPFGYAGQVAAVVDGKPMTFRVHRLHLEEDAGKLIHQGHQTLVDLNRAGTPLMEIVSEPDFRSPAEAKAYLQEVRLIMRYLGVSDADMEKGHLRCDANVSLRPVGEDTLYPKTEIKNLNSFKAVERALLYEVQRQKDIWADGKPPMIQATRGWDEAMQKTVEQRTKEEAADYRYFPEPDIPPVSTSDEHLEELRKTIPELPEQRLERFIEMYELGSLSSLLVADPELSKLFEETISEYRLNFQELYKEEANQKWEEYKKMISKHVFDWLMNIPVEIRNDSGLPSAKDMSLIVWSADHGVGNSFAKQAFTDMMVTGKSAKEALFFIEDSFTSAESALEDLKSTVKKVISENPKIVAEIKSGKVAATQYIVGQVMKETKGMAKRFPDEVQGYIKAELGL